MEMMGLEMTTCLQVDGLAGKGIGMNGCFHTCFAARHLGESAGTAANPARDMRLVWLGAMVLVMQLQCSHGVLQKCAHVGAMQCTSLRAADQFAAVDH